MKALITGGARSGKSAFAEAYAATMSESGIYVATSHIHDEEMADRITRHRQSRDRGGYRWETVEEAYDLDRLLARLAGEASTTKVVLVDCLTLWLSNWLLREEDAAMLEQRMHQLTVAVSTYPGRLLLVTNEVGDGIVPEYKLGRRFRDEAGRLHQQIAKVCDQVFLVTAGIPVELKALAYRLPGEGGA